MITLDVLFYIGAELDDGKHGWTQFNFGSVGNALLWLGAQISKPNQIEWAHLYDKNGVRLGTFYQDSEIKI